MKKLLILIIPFVLASCTVVGQTSLFNLTRYIRLNGQKMQYDSTRVGVFKNLATEGYVQGWVASHGSGFSLTTNNSNGLATYSGGILNIPNYATGVYVSGFVQGTRPSINFISSGAISVGGADDVGNNRVNITIGTTAITGVGIKNNGSLIGTRPTVNLIPGTNVTLAIADNPGSSQVDVTINSSGGTGLSGSLAVSLTDGATIPVDATLGFSVGALYKVIIAGNRTISNPTGAVSGQKFLFRITQDATGSRVITWDTKFRFSTDMPVPVLSTSASYTDYIGFIYNSTDDKFDIISVNLGVH